MIENRTARQKDFFDTLKVQGLRLLHLFKFGIKIGT